jgi:hypothetical protein
VSEVFFLPALFGSALHFVVFDDELPSQLVKCVIPLFDVIGKLELVLSLFEIKGFVMLGQQTFEML